MTRMPAVAKLILVVSIIGGSLAVAQEFIGRTQEQCKAVVEGCVGRQHYPTNFGESLFLTEDLTRKELPSEFRETLVEIPPNSIVVAVDDIRPPGVRSPRLGFGVVVITKQDVKSLRDFYWSTLASSGLSPINSENGIEFDGKGREGKVTLWARDDGNTEVLIHVMVS